MQTSSDFSSISIAESQSGQHSGTKPPYSPRALTRSERRRGDLYIFKSPKVSRRVELIGCVNMALALKMEFDPDIATYVERPRKLTLASGTSKEFAFWVKSTSGSEYFLLSVAASETAQSPGPRHEHRLAREIIEASQIAHVVIEFSFEDELRRESAALSTWYRLLPYVQTAHVLPNREALAQQVRALFHTMDSTTVEHVEQHLRMFCSAEVRAVLFDLVQRGELKLVDPNRLGRWSVVSRRDR